MNMKQNLRDGQRVPASYVNELSAELAEQSAHVEGSVASEAGAHGLRAGPGYLQRNVDGVWTDLIGKFIPKTVYGVSIDLSNSNPKTCVTYTDDAVGMVPGTDWLEQPIFNTIRPCLFKEGKVVGYLNPNNFAQFEDGTEADITSGEAGDVMIEIPKIGYKIAKAGTTLTVQITNDPAKDGFSYLAHTRDNEGDRDFLYIGAFLGSGTKSLRSLSEALPREDNIWAFRSAAQTLGPGYDLLSFYPVTLLQCLYLVMYKNLNSQAALGMGYVGDFDFTIGKVPTGATIDKGMCSGSSNSLEQVKFLGLEDLWGNLDTCIEGLVIGPEGQILVATGSFTETGEGYTSIGTIPCLGSMGALSDVLGTTEAGFIASILAGSTSTGFADYINVSITTLTTFGGSSVEGSSAGVFRLTFQRFLDESYNIGSRLMYL